MFIRKKMTTAIAVAITGMLVAGASHAAPSYPTDDKILELNSNVPETFKRLLTDSERIIAKFDAGNGFDGYVVETPQQDAIIYHNAETMVAFSGMMLVDSGINVTQEHYDTEVPKPDYTNVLDEVKADDTVLTEGNVDAENELWVFFDPNCPHCNTIWKTSRSFIESGELKVHWMPVAFLSNTSAGKVARFWQDENPVEKFNETEALFDQGGSDPVSSSEITSETRRMLQDNLDYMSAFGANGTPTIVYENKQGDVGVISSAMDEERMAEFLESLK